MTKKKEKTIASSDSEVKENVVKVKMPLQVAAEQTITKVNLDKPIVNEEVTTVVEEKPVIQEITNEAAEEIEQIVAATEDAIIESVKTGNPLPENIEKLVSFMEDTGGDLNDYIKLNKDYQKMDNQDLLLEYYKQTKPHLDTEEISFLMEDQFSYDEDIDDEKEIKRKKLALKEHVAQARLHLDSAKSKYYEDIKAGSKLTKEQQDAIDYFNKHSKEVENTKRYEMDVKSDFLKKTNRFFGDQFKGFDFETGDKKFRFNINDINEVKNAQSDIVNFIGKFLDKNGRMSDEAGYHKALYTAMNPDAIANHFYEQGKADALRQSITESKNVDMNPRQELGVNTNPNGVTARVIGNTSTDFKFKIKQK